MTSKPTILVVDDDGPILLLMHNLLREFGFEPHGASSGAEALDLARTHRPDLVLLDKHMPGMNGEEVIRRLRVEPGLEEVPVLILSGEPLGPDELAALGANAAILKPFDVPALIEQIRATIGATA
jgi:CheY-like chemotaxis protein